MKEFSIHIRVYPLRSMRLDVYRFEADAFDFSPSPEDGDAGRSFNCDKDITVSLPPSFVLTDFALPRPCIVELADTGGVRYRIGNRDLPAFVSLTPNLNTATFSLRARTLVPPLLRESQDSF